MHYLNIFLIQLIFSFVNAAENDETDSKSSNMNDLVLRQVIGEILKEDMDKNPDYMKNLMHLIKHQHGDEDQEAKVNSFGCKQMGYQCDVNAECVDKLDSFVCQCKQGYVGNGLTGDCFNGEYCSGKYCRWNGVCDLESSVSGYKCKCGLECLNGGACVMTQFRYECKCLPKFTGLTCNQTHI
jgi:hypothetical protein